MKKVYQAPTMKVVEINTVNMLCMSGGGDKVGVFNESVEGETDETTGRGVAW